MSEQRYIRGEQAQAACSLIDHLSGLGIAASVGYPRPNRKRELIVQIKCGDTMQVPPEWNGFTTRIETNAEEDRECHQ